MRITDIKRMFTPGSTWEVTVRGVTETRTVAYTNGSGVRWSEPTMTIWPKKVEVVAAEFGRLEIAYQTGVMAVLTLVNYVPPKV